MKKIIIYLSLCLPITGFVLNASQPTNDLSTTYIAGDEDIDIILG